MSHGIAIQADAREISYQEALQAGGGAKLSVLVKLSGKAPLPVSAEVITQFGNIVAARLHRKDLRAFSQSDAVENFEVARSLRRSRDLSERHSRGHVAGNTRRPAGVTATGKGTVIAVIDWGVDFAFESLLMRESPQESANEPPRPRTRFLGIWDQRGGDHSQNRWGYGRIFNREDIDAALLADDPYKALGYHPGHADTRSPRSGRWQGAHGTHVIDIAAGNGNGGGQSGVAPEAELLFCHLSRSTPPVGPGTLGDSANILHALDWIFETAGDRPVVVNASLGAQAGEHSGQSFCEVGIDRAVECAPGRYLVSSAGNYYDKDAHASGRLCAEQSETVRIHVPANDPTASEIELWHAPVDLLSIRLIGPRGLRTEALSLGTKTQLKAGGKTVAHVTYGPRHSGDVALRVILAPRAPAGEWQLRMRPQEIVDGRYHVWIERDSGLQPKILGDAVDPNYTTGTICNGHNSITVGAIDTTKDRLKMGRFSSAGPTRDGRIKPELVAPGVQILAARSAPPAAGPRPRYITKSGTSMAAPHVTGTIALMQEIIGAPIGIAEMRGLLFSSLARPKITDKNVLDRDLHRLGHGILDIAAAEQAARNWHKTKPHQEDETMNRPHQIPQQTAYDTKPPLPSEFLNTDAYQESDLQGDFASDLEPADSWDDFQEEAFLPQDNVADAAWNWDEPNAAQSYSPDTYDATALDVSGDIPEELWTQAPLVEQADPWCQRRADIARVARNEERIWRRPNGQKAVESDPPRLTQLVRYWTATGRRPQDAQDTARRSAADQTPWSAAFICYVMHSAGVRRADGFQFSGAHISYIVQALRNRERSDQARPFWLVDSVELVNETTLKPGDLICLNRMIRRNGRRVSTNHSYDSLRRDYWLNNNQAINPVSAANTRARIIASHTSVVVGTEVHNGQPHIQMIGGNEGHSVRMTRVPINASGGIDNPGAHNIFGAIKIVRC